MMNEPQWSLAGNAAVCHDAATTPHAVIVCQSAAGTKRFRVPICSFGLGLRVSRFVQQRIQPGQGFVAVVSWRGGKIGACFPAQHLTDLRGNRQVVVRPIVLLLEQGSLEARSLVRRKLSHLRQDGFNSHWHEIPRVHLVRRMVQHGPSSQRSFYPAVGLRARVQRRAIPAVHTLVVVWSSCMLGPTSSNHVIIAHAVLEA